MNPNNKRIFYGITITTVFLLMIVSTLYYDPFHMLIDELHLGPFLLILSFVVGAGTFAFMSEKIEKKEVSLKKTTGLILKFLNEDEKKIVQKLIDSKGRILQAEITRLPNMSKLKTHRSVKKLLVKNIIEIEKFGKTNVIRFPKEIQEALIS